MNTEINVFTGGMQDYNYLKHGIFEILVEISCCKYPNESDIEYYWIENKAALINYLMEVHRGKMFVFFLFFPCQTSNFMVHNSTDKQDFYFI